MANFGPIAKLGDDECKKIFEKYDALDASSSGMDATEFKTMLRQEFCIQGSDAELDKEFAAANKDNSADTLGEDLCCEEFIEWVKSKRQWMMHLSKCKLVFFLWVNRFQGATVSEDGCPICEDTEASEKIKNWFHLFYQWRMLSINEKD